MKYNDNIRRLLRKLNCFGKNSCKIYESQIAFEKGHIDRTEHALVIKEIVRYRDEYRRYV